MAQKLAVVSLGGSLVAPHEPDVVFLKNFSSFIRRNKNWQFVIVVGGGWPARAWQKAARKLGVSDHDELDRLGVRATRLNAQLVRIMMGRLAEPIIITDPSLARKFKRQVLVGAGFKPGKSTDYRAVQMAVRFGAKKIFNLTNTNAVYDRDPKRFRSARPFTKLGWAAYLKIVGSRWTPGLNLPFDPIASKLAKLKGIEVDIINGKRLGEVQKAMEGKPFSGTQII